MSEAARILPGEAMYGRLPADLRDVGSEARAPRPARLAAETSMHLMLGDDEHRTPPWGKGARGWFVA